MPWGSLVVLSLVKTHFNQDALKQLAPAIASSASPLERVDLRANRLGEEAGLVLDSLFKPREGFELLL